MMRHTFVIIISLFCVVAAGCALSQKTGDSATTASYPLTDVEWVRNGESVEFEGEAWYPTREVEVFLDSEVFPVVVLRDVQFFIERTDIKPFQRLYTRFSKNRYRAFEKQQP